MARTEVTGKQIKDQSVDLAVDVTGVLPVANGGTGSSSLTLNNVLLGNGTGALQSVSPGTAGNVLTSNGSTWVSAVPAAAQVTLNGSETLSNKTLTNPKIDYILDPNGAPAMWVGSQANAVNYAWIRNGAGETTGPQFRAAGPGTTIDVGVFSKGAGMISLGDGGSYSVAQFRPAASSPANYFVFQNTSAGGVPSLSVTGSDANVSINLISKGSGSVQANGVDVAVASRDFTNLASGSDFSNGTFGPWKSVSRWVLATDQAHSGTTSIKLPPGSGGGSMFLGTYPTVHEFKPGDQVYMEFWAYADDAYVSDLDGKLRIGNQDNTLRYYLFAMTAQMTTRNTWLKFSTTYTVPAGDTGLIFSLQWNTTSGNLWIDDIVIRRVPAIESLPSTVITTTAAQTLTNKTLTTPTITTPTVRGFLLKDSNDNNIAAHSNVTAGTGTSYLSLAPGTGSPGPSVSAASSETNTGLVFWTKGTGLVQFRSNANSGQSVALRLLPHAGGVNWLDISNAPSGSSPTLKSVSYGNTDANVGLNLETLGSGMISLKSDNVHISGGSVTSLKVDSQGTAGRSELLLNDDGDTKAYVQWRGSTNPAIPNTLRIQTNTGVTGDIVIGDQGASRIFIAGGQNGVTAGRVGIGTATPSSTLDVNGEIRQQAVPVVTTTGSQTLTNKTISGSSNTLSNIPQSAVTSLTTDITGLLNRARAATRAGNNLLTNTAFTFSDFIQSYGTLSSEQSRLGNTSLKITGTGQLQYPSLVSDTAYQRINVRKGQKFYYEMWVYGHASNTITSGTSELISFGLWFYDKAGTYQTSAREWTKGNGDTIGTGQWVLISGTLTVPDDDDITNMAPLLYVSTNLTAGNILYVDAVVLREVTEAVNINQALYGQNTPGSTVLATSLPSTIKVGTLQDTDGDLAMVFSSAAGAVNGLYVYGSTTGVAPSLQAWGADTNISLNLTSKGSGTVQANGVPVVTTSGSQTLTNKTISGASNTFSSIPATAVPGAAQYVRAHGSVANQWYRIFTFSPPGNPFFRFSAVYAISCFSQGGAVIGVHIGNWGENSVGGNVEFIGKGTLPLLARDSFKLVGDGYGQPFELWVKTTASGSALAYYEVSRYGSGYTTYDTSNTPQATEPVGQVLNVKSSGLASLDVGSGDLASTATPAHINLGGTYGNSTPGSSNNLKLRLFDDGTGSNRFGLGISNTKLEYQVPSTSTHRFYVGGTERLTVSSSAVQVAGADVVTTTAAQTLTNKTINSATLNSPTIGSPTMQVVKGINGGTVLYFADGGPGTNYLSVVNRAPGYPPYFRADGGDANIGINFLPKGSGIVTVKDVPVVTTTAAQTLTNKTLTTPTINSPAVSLSSPSDITATVPTNQNLNIGGGVGGYPAYSPVSKYLWHDLLRFSRHGGLPTYETSANGTTWTSASLNKNVFDGKESFCFTLADGSTTKGVRWTWQNNNFAFCGIEWWVIGFCYTNPGPVVTALVESSPDGTTWTTLHSSTVTSNASTAWLPSLSNGSHTRIRLTLVSTNGALIRLSSIKALSYRPGDQGSGAWLEQAYDWDADRNIYAPQNLRVLNPQNTTQSAVTVDASQTLTNKTLTSPKMNQILDANGAGSLLFTATTSGVNYTELRSGQSGGANQIRSIGSDTNINMMLVPKGSGGLQLYAGTTSPFQISVSSANTNQSINIATKGSGTVNANGIPVVTTTGSQTLTNKTLTGPTIDNARTNNIRDLSGNSNISVDNPYSRLYLTPGGKAGIEILKNDNGVNFLLIQAASTGFPVYLAATGADANVGLNLATKGSGVVYVNNIPVVTTTAAQTLTNKTLTAPTLQDPKVEYLRNVAGSNVLRLVGGASDANGLTLSSSNGNPYFSSTTGYNFLLGNADNSFFITAPAGATKAVIKGGAINATNADLDLQSSGTGTVQANGSPVVTTTGAQALTNKTLTTPVINGLPTGTGVSSAATGNTLAARNSAGDTTFRYLHAVWVSNSHAVVTRNSDTAFYSTNDNYIRKNTATGFKTSLALNNVDNTSDATKNSAVATLTNKTLTSPTISTPTINGTTTISGDVTVDNGTSSLVVIRSDDTGTSGLLLRGQSQGTSYVEVTQDGSYGGGMSFFGGGGSTFATGESTDSVTFYRKGAGTRTAVFGYGWNSNNVNFAGNIAVAGNITSGGIAVPTISSSSTLTNKTISGSSNTLTNISISSLSNAPSLFNNMGEVHQQRTSFDAQGAASTVDFGWRYVQGSTNGPGTNSATQYYSQFVGLGSNYAYNTYGMQIAYPRNVTSPYISIRYQEGSVFGSWRKISAGYADSAGDADTLDGQHASAFVTPSGTATLTNKTLTSPTISDPVINGNATGTAISTANTANTLVKRDGNGDFYIRYVFSSYLNMSHGVSGTTNDTIFYSSKDNYIRKNNASGFKSSLGLNNVDNTSDATKNSATATLTNKRITPRIGSVTSTATPSINTDIYDQYNITALATNITSVTVTGTPTDGQKLMLRIKGTATRTIAWGSSFISSGVALLPTTTSGTYTHMIGLIYDSAKAKWVCVAADWTGY